MPSGERELRGVSTPCSRLPSPPSFLSPTENKKCEDPATLAKPVRSKSPTCCPVEKNDTVLASETPRAHGQLTKVIESDSPPKVVVTPEPRHLPGKATDASDAPESIVLDEGSRSPSPHPQQLSFEDDDGVENCDEPEKEGFSTNSDASPHSVGSNRRVQWEESIDASSCATREVSADSNNDGAHTRERSNSPSRCSANASMVSFRPPSPQSVTPEAMNESIYAANSSFYSPHTQDALQRDLSQSLTPKQSPSLNASMGSPGTQPCRHCGAVPVGEQQYPPDFLLDRSQSPNIGDVRPLKPPYGEEEIEQWASDVQMAPPSPVSHIGAKPPQDFIGVPKNIAAPGCLKPATVQHSCGVQSVVQEAPIPITPPRRPPSNAVVAPEDAEETHTVSRSWYHFSYLTTGPPTENFELTCALFGLIMMFAKRHRICEEQARAFFHELTINAIKAGGREEYAKQVARTAARFWTSSFKLDHAYELSAILNDIIRHDYRWEMQHAIVFVHALTAFLNDPHGGGIRLSPPTEVYRGGSLPCACREFFFVGQTYRTPMYVASSISKEVALEFIELRRPSFPGEPVLWVMLIDPMMKSQDCGNYGNFIGEFRDCNIPDEGEFLFMPYTPFTVVNATWEADPTPETPHCIVVQLQLNGRCAPLDCPSAPWC